MAAREVRRIPAEIWKMSEPTVTKVFVTDAPVAQITLDPMLETADVDMSDNYWPARDRNPLVLNCSSPKEAVRDGAASSQGEPHAAIHRRDAEMQSGGCRRFGGFC